MTEKLGNVISLIKDLVSKQEEERKLLVKLVVTVLNKEEGPFTLYEWEKRKADVLYQAGLGPKPFRGYSVRKDHG